MLFVLDRIIYVTLMTERKVIKIGDVRWLRLVFVTRIVCSKKSENSDVLLDFEWKAVDPRNCSSKEQRILMLLTVCWSCLLGLLQIYGIPNLG